MKSRHQKKQVRYVEHVGFCHGTQGLSTEHEEAHLAAQTREEEEAVRRDTVDDIQNLEAAEAILVRQHIEASKLWFTLRDRTSGRAPNAILAKVVTVLASAVLVGEAVLISPTLDGLGIPNLPVQLFVALVIVLTAGLLVHLVQHRLFGEQNSLGRSEPRRPWVGQSGLHADQHLSLGPDLFPSLYARPLAGT